MKHIYFMRRADGIGPIKIGCSKWQASRLKTMQVWSPHLLEIVITVPGDFADEKRLHNQFSMHRLHGEWFEPAAPLLALIARCAATGDLPAPPPDDRVVRVVAMFKGGATLQAIGCEFGLSRQRIEQILRKAGVAGRGHVGTKRAPSWVKLDEIRSLAESGLSAKQIAASIGDTYANVIRVARFNDIRIERSKRVAHEETVGRAFAVAADYKSGMLSREIAEKYHLKYIEEIYRLLKIAGVDASRRKATDISVLPVQDILKDYKEGETLTILAARHHCTARAIKLAIAKHGRLRSREESEAIRRAAVSRANLARHAA